MGNTSIDTTNRHTCFNCCKKRNEFYMVKISSHWYCKKSKFYTTNECYEIGYGLLIKFEKFIDTLSEKEKFLFDKF